MMYDTTPLPREHRSPWRLWSTPEERQRHGPSPKVDPRPRRSPCETFREKVSLGIEEDAYVHYTDQSHSEANRSSVGDAQHMSIIGEILARKSELTFPGQYFADDTHVLCISY